MKSETRNFRMHPQLLMDVIQRQAGTLSKAILEGVMNGIDAGARKIAVSLTPNQLTITDDGRGFESRQNIEKFFEVFGQPHEEGENKTFGTFRMGRGQLFAFGRNTWTSGRWQMDVDVKGRGLDYQLIEHPEDRGGCSIAVALYTELLPSVLGEAERDIESWCRYAPIPVFFSDRQVSVDPSSEQWDHVIPEAYVRLKKVGSLAIYNLGVHVMDLPSYKFGTAGVIVSRKQLKVNFARNDIQSDCPVWKKVRPLLNQWATSNNVKSKCLNDDARQRLADQIRSGELDLNTWANRKLRLITGVTGRQFSIGDFLVAEHVTAAPQGDRVGEKLHLSGRAFVVADITLERFGVSSVKELVDFFNKRLPDWAKGQMPASLSFKKLAKEVDSRYELLAEADLTPNQRVWLELAQTMSWALNVPGEDGVPQVRKLCIGEGPALGWTDAVSYTAVGREFLETLDLNISGIVALSAVLIHEACHVDSDLEGHDHDQAYYERFHDVLHKCQPAMVARAVASLPKILEDQGRRLTKRQLKEADMFVRADRQKARLEATSLACDSRA